MSFETIERKRVKAKTEHSCSWCNSTIEKGEEYTYNKNKTEDNLHAWYECDRCKDLVEEMFKKGYDDQKGYCDSDDFSCFIENEYGISFQELYEHQKCL
jgi:hypothetical protein